MISLDQVFLLEQKVESAVEKIQQLQAENDALRSKCLELTNALSSKSEQLTTFVNDQDQIESGIKKALERLNSIENSVLKAAVQVASTPSVAPATPVTEPAENTAIPSFDAMENVPVSEPEQEIIENNEPVIEETEVESEIEQDTAEETADEEISIPVQKDPFETGSTDNFNRAIDRSAFAGIDFDSPAESETPQEDITEETFADDENQDGLGFDIF